MSPEPSVNSPASPGHSNLIGRDELLAQLRGYLADPPANCILLDGPSGIGKSALLYELATLLPGGPRQVVLHHEIESRAEPLGSFLGRLLIPLLDQETVREFDWQKFREELNRAPWEKSRRLTTAALLDLVVTLAPGLKRTVETLVSVVTEALSQADLKSQIDRLLETRKQDFLLAFVSILGIVERMEIGGYILIDRLDAASPQTVAAVKTMIESLPPAWGLLLAINNELPEGIQARSELWPPIAYRAGHKVEVPTLTALDVEEWLRRTGRMDIAHETVERVVRMTGGRPLFIREWISSPTSELEQDEITRRLGAYYDKRLAGLSTGAKTLIRHLSLLPARVGFSFDFCEKILADDLFDVLEVLEELIEQNFIERDPSGLAEYRIVHETTSRVLYDQMPERVRQRAGARLLEVIGASPLPVDTTLNRYCQVALARDASRDDVIRELGLETAHSLVESGAFGLAEETLMFTLEALTKESSGGRHLSDEFEARLTLASLRLHVGSYAKGLDEIEACESLATRLDQIGRLELLRGMLLVRLNHYASSLASLKKSSRAFLRQGDDASALIAAKFVNITLRDRGAYRRATWHARALVARARARKVSESVLGSCLRALARSLALTQETEEAVAAANEAYVIADTAGRIGDLGNALLAKGEAFRHGGGPSEAELWYSEALTIAKLTFNRDSALWSGLGLADSLMLQQKYKEAGSVLATEVGALVKESPDRHPIEHLHWKLADATLRFLKGYARGEDVIGATEGYAKLGVEWPLKSASLLIDRGLHTPFRF